MARHLQAMSDPARPSSAPDVLFISIDDLSHWAGFLGGHPDAKTPHLDALAARGVAFTNAHTPAPACNPSRTAVMTGIRPSTSGIYLNSNKPWRSSPALADVETIPGCFRSAGYRAAGTGKIFHDLSDARSWDTYWPADEGPRPQDPAPRPELRPLNGIERSGNFDWGPLDVTATRMRDWKIADKAIELLEEPRDRPRFVACGFFRPHLPWYVPRTYFERFEADRITLPPVMPTDASDLPPRAQDLIDPVHDQPRLGDPARWRSAVHGYLASMAFADDCLGHLIAGLDRNPHRANTIVVLWSDHGWHFGEKTHWRKFSLWEEATRVPMVVIAPGVTTPGARCDAAVSTLDLFPTLLDLCGLPAKPDLEGRTLVPLLRDPDRAFDSTAVTSHGRNNHSVRSRHWRYIRYADGSEELYDHRHDPHEWFNLAHDRSAAEAKRWLAAHLPKVNVPETVERRGWERRTTVGEDTTP